MHICMQIGTEKDREICMQIGTEKDRERQRKTEMERIYSCIEPKKYRYINMHIQINIHV